MGVRRAVELACMELDKTPKSKVFALGHLIHNPQALNDLKRRNLETIDEAELPENFDNAIVIIRAHGVNPMLEKELHNRGAQVIDATCPIVKANQLKAASLAKAGYHLFIAGDKSHAEITGILGVCRALPNSENACIPEIVNSASMAEKSAKKLFLKCTDAKTALIGQTTISAEEYSSIGNAIARYFPCLEITQTLCSAVKERQDSLRELAGKVDAIIVAGGKESANTKSLYDIAKTSGRPCILVETARDIPPEFYNFKTIGLSAGTSTPDSVIAEIEKAIN